MSAPSCPACESPLRYTGTKLGGYSFSCGNCGTQGFAKSPRAAEAFRARVEPAAPEPAPATAPATAPAPAPAGKPAPRKTIPDVEIFGR